MPLAALPLTVDEVAVEQLQRPLADGSVRRTALVTLHGGGEEGVGEEVTFQPADVLSPAPSPGESLLQRRIPWAGLRTLQNLWAALDAADLFPPPPQWDVVRSYRRWAIEAAALDLALRQAATTLPASLGRDPSPLRFVASPPRGWVGSLPAGVGLKLDAAAIEPGLPVEIVDFKGIGDGELIGRVREAYPHALLEDPPVAIDGAHVSWDAPVRSAADLDRLPTPAAVNVKPARLGSIIALFTLYAACAGRKIATYGGGQWEIGPGRAQAQLLASLFHAEAPNDLAPSPYNDVRPSEPLPTSPLDVRPRVGFGLV